VDGDLADTAIIGLVEQPAGLRWGIGAEVPIEGR